MRIVLDTNILVRANPTASPHGLARQLLSAYIAKPNILAPLLEEVRRVLAYNLVQKRWQLTSQHVNQYLLSLVDVGCS